MSVLIKGVLLYGEGDQVDVLIEDGQITRIEAGIGAGIETEVDTAIEAPGQILLPGFVDLHTHLREPGREDTETIDSGSPRPRSAATPRCSRWPIPTPSPTAPW